MEIYLWQNVTTKTCNQTLEANLNVLCEHLFVYVCIFWIVLFIYFYLQISKNMFHVTRDYFFIRNN